MPAALGALAHDEVEPGLLVRERVPHRTAQRADETPALLEHLRHVGWRRAERVGDELRLGMGEDHLDLRRRGRRGPAEQLVVPLLLGHLRHAVVGEQLRGEVAVAVGHELLHLRLELLGRHVLDAHALVLGRDHEVDAVRPVAHVLVEPRQLDLELLGREPDGAEHAEPTGLGHRGDDVAAVREGVDRELDAEAFGELGAHPPEGTGAPDDPSDLAGDEAR